MNTVEDLFVLFENHGSNDYIGEAISQIEHASQAAAMAEKEGYEIEVILAAFFHDIGHLLAHLKESSNMNGFGVVNHELIGAELLKKCGFPKKTVRLVASHVQAKRYLCWKNPKYYKNLSLASKETLKFQGGIMTIAEAEAFEKDELFKLIIRMRVWDEQAKKANIPLPDLNKYKEMCYKVINV